MANLRQQPDDVPDSFGGEYSVVSLPDAWHVMSLVCFLAALGARYLTALLPSGRGFFYRPVLTAFSVPLLAAVGVLLGLLALRKPETRAAGRVALTLNGIVLGLGLLALAAFYYILPG